MFGVSQNLFMVLLFLYLLILYSFQKTQNIFIYNHFKIFNFLNYISFLSNFFFITMFIFRYVFFYQISLLLLLLYLDMSFTFVNLFCV